MSAETVKRMTAWQAEQDRLDAIYIRNTRLARLVTEDTAALLERLANMVVAWGDRGIYSDDMDKARVTAARIREALRG